MSDLELFLWYAAAAVATLGSATFSGIETGIYSLNRVRLHVMADANHRGAAILERLTLRPNRLLGTLLVGNNIVNYTASVAIGVLLEDAGYTGWSQVIFSTAILTPLLFTFGEVLPKDLFRSNADTLTYPFARPLLWMGRLLTATGILPLIDAVSWLMHRLFGGERSAMDVMHPRRQVTSLIREGVGHGVISAYQSAIVDRVLEMERVTVGSVMTEWSDVVTVRTNQPPEAVWALANRVPHSRVPLVDEAGRVVGILAVKDVLMHDPARCPALTQLAGPVLEIDAKQTCRAALRRLQQQRRSMAVVLDRGRLAGLVTTKDLVEPIVGELEAW
jgi:CBS domain containing-hemolysin-like protein